jgi:hypothetical protein
MDPFEVNYFPYIGLDGLVDDPVTVDQALRRGTMTDSQAAECLKGWGVPPELILRSLDSHGMG